MIRLVLIPLILLSACQPTEVPKQSVRTATCAFASPCYEVDAALVPRPKAAPLHGGNDTQFYGDRLKNDKRKGYSLPERVAGAILNPPNELDKFERTNHGRSQ